MTRTSENYFSVISSGSGCAGGAGLPRGIMDTVGHTDIKHAELYSREAK
ncbi:hypothetical protein GGC47_004900 [Bosea sp. OAE752]